MSTGFAADFPQKKRAGFFQPYESHHIDDSSFFVEDHQICLIELSDVFNDHSYRIFDDVFGEKAMLKHQLIDGFSALPVHLIDCHGSYSFLSDFPLFPLAYS
jgi:hypothetical protein